jgi:hypothetical protein
MRETYMQFILYDIAAKTITRTHKINEIIIKYF